jgi:hypothetical protein
LHSQLENNDEDKVSLEHCLSTGNPGEFAGRLRIEEIVFLIDEHSKSSTELYASPNKQT